MANVAEINENYTNNVVHEYCIDFMLYVVSTIPTAGNMLGSDHRSR
jgi:hypothetical protein